MSAISELVLVESQSARDEQIASISDNELQSALNKAKALHFAHWQGTGIATTEQMADFYEVPIDTVRAVASRSKEEFAADGLREIKGKDLKALLCIGHDMMQLPESTTRLMIWTPRAAIRLGMLLRDSAVARAVRTSLLDRSESASIAVAEFQQLKGAVEKLQESVEKLQMQMDSLTQQQAIASPVQATELPVSQPKQLQPQHPLIQSSNDLTAAQRERNRQEMHYATLPGSHTWQACQSIKNLARAGKV